MKAICSIARVILLALFVLVITAALPDSTDAVETRFRSVSSSLKLAFLDTKPDLILTGPTESYTQYGNHPRFGDVNGDGYEDLLVAGASRYNECQGRLYLYYGGTSMDDKPDKIFTGEKAGDYFGEDAYLADVNGDNYVDVIVGCFGYNSKQGRVYIFYGRPDMDENADLILDGEPGTQGAFGLSITAGDLNNDGYDDVVVTASSFNNKTGRVYLFYGGDPMDTTVDLTFDGENENDRFGRDIDNPKMVGDVNGDGYGDLLISTRTWNYWAGVSGQGRAYLYYGGPGTSMDSIPDKVFTGENRRDDFGVSGGIFDIDNDGFDDVIIGARYYNNIQGRVYVYWGGEDMDTIADKVFDGEPGAKGSFGCGLDAGYVNDDDYGDIIVAAPYYQRGSWEGKAYLFYGDTKESINTTCDKTLTLPTDTWNKSQHVALGDLQNDSFPDVAIGGYHYNNGQGRVWIYYNKAPGSTDEPPRSLPEAAAAGGVDEVKALISTGVDVNAREWGSLKTALHYGAEKGHKKVVELLLAKGANTDARDALSTTPLHHAVEKGHKEVAELLIAKGADINAKDAAGYMPLHSALWNTDLDMAKLLVSKGANVNIRDVSSYTPLHWAVMMDSRELTELLLSKGADLNVKDWAGQPPLASAFTRAIEELLVAKGAEVSTLFCAVAIGDLDKIKAFINGGADVNATWGGWRPLHSAALLGYRDVAELLLAHGADVNAKDHRDRIPLHLAAQAGHADVVELLIAKGANVDGKDNKGRTPLSLAEQKGHKEVIELLRKHGAKE